MPTTTNPAPRRFGCTDDPTKGCACDPPTVEPCPFNPKCGEVPNCPSCTRDALQRRRNHLNRLFALLDYMGGDDPQQAIADLTDYCANAGEDTEADAEAVAHAAAFLLGVPFKET